MVAENCNFEIIYSLFDAYQRGRGDDKCMVIARNKISFQNRGCCGSLFLRVKLRASYHGCRGFKYRHEERT